MEHWDEQSIHKMTDRKLEQGYNFPHPDFQSPSGSLANYIHHYSYPVMSTSGNTANPNFNQLMYQYGMNVKNQVQLGAIQFCHPVLSYDLSGGAAMYNYYHGGSHNGYVLPSSRDHLIPFNNGYPQSTSITTGVTNEQSGNYHVSDSHRVTNKRKHPEVVNADLASATSRQVHEEPNENGFNVMNPAAFMSSECLQSVEVPTPCEQHGSERSKYQYNSLQQQPEFPYNIGHSFQPSIFGWVGPLGNYSHGGGCYSWNFMGPMNYGNGSGAVESINVNMQDYREATTYGNPSFVSHPPALSNQHQHLSSVQDMQVHSYNQNTQTVAPSYWHPVSNLPSCSTHPTVDDMNSAQRSPRSSPVAQEYNWPLPEAAEEYEDADESSSDSVSDQHGDMRLDIEDMSYEELLALEEWIGDVNTGLSEASIVKNLKTSVCAPLALSLLDLSSKLLNEKCVICLVEYEEHERIGTLDCGHSYHADCIKEWLLMKNLCPICKTSALASDRKE